MVADVGVEVGLVRGREVEKLHILNDIRACFGLPSLDDVAPGSVARHAQQYQLRRSRSSTPTVPSGPAQRTWRSWR